MRNRVGTFLLAGLAAVALSSALPAQTGSATGIGEARGGIRARPGTRSFGCLEHARPARASEGISAAPTRRSRPR